MHHPTDRIAFVTPVVEHWLEREIAQWVDRHEAPTSMQPFLGRHPPVQYSAKLAGCPTTSDQPSGP